MSYKVFYRKYRPQTFDEVVGQKYIVETLKNEIINNSISHAYIFTGPRGTGKTSTAKIFAKSVNCFEQKNGNPCLKCFNCQNFRENPDIIEIDAASNNGVEEIRNLIDNVKLLPSNSKYKVYIIDEVHMLSQSAFNALLLTLEEPPEHVIFILATTDIQSVPITILSRTQRFDFSKISYEDIEIRLSEICKIENIEIESDAIKEVAILSNGALRDALGMLEQISMLGAKKILKEDIEKYYGLVSETKINILLKYILDNDIQKVLEMLNQFCNLGIDVCVLTNELIESIKKYVINLKIKKDNNKILNLIDLIFDLIEKNNVNKNISSYTILEMLLLKYITNNQDTTCEYFPGNKNVEEKQDEDSEDMFQYIRINNCFVDANKNDLIKSMKNWEIFKTSHEVKKTEYYEILLRVDIGASSDRYLILLTKNKFDAEFINKNCMEIEKIYDLMFETNMKLIAIEYEKWLIKKNEYIKRKHDGLKYCYINEEDI